MLALPSPMSIFVITSIFLFYTCFSQNEVNKILIERHNSVRRNVSPSAEYMPDLVYDEVLFKIATEHVEKCEYKHSSNDWRSNKYFEYGGALGKVYVGENLAYSYGFKDYLSKSVEMWADEAKHYNYETNSCEPGHVCGHYTQIVWAKTTRIGCAHKVCRINGNDVDMVFCNYAVGGNFNGEKPYVLKIDQQSTIQHEQSISNTQFNQFRNELTNAINRNQQQNHTFSQFHHNDGQNNLNPIPNRNRPQSQNILPNAPNKQQKIPPKFTIPKKSTQKTNLSVPKNQIPPNPSNVQNDTTKNPFPKKIPPKKISTLPKTGKLQNQNPLIQQTNLAQAPTLPVRNQVQQQNQQNSYQIQFLNGVPNIQSNITYRVQFTQSQQNNSFLFHFLSDENEHPHNQFQQNQHQIQQNQYQNVLNRPQLQNIHEYNPYFNY